MLSTGNGQQSFPPHMPEQAVNSYLSVLLNEGEVERPAQSRTAPVKKMQPAADSAGVAGGQPAVAGDRARQTPVEPAPALTGSTQNSFQILLFKSDDVTMAVPLSALDSIVRWYGEANSIPGQPDWQVGVMRHRGRFVVLLNILRLIMPERQHSIPAAEQRNGHILIIGGGRWGLVCDSLQRPQTVDRARVRWRLADSGRPWIAGLLLEKLCVLLNVEALLDLLWHK